MKLRNLFRRCCRWVLWALAAVALTLAGLVFYGLPAPLLEWALDSASPDWPVRADRLVYRPGTGWIADDVKVYAPGNHVTPFLTFGTVEIRADLPRRLLHGEWKGEVEFHRGDVDTNLGLWADDLRTDQLCRVRGLRGRISHADGVVELHNITGQVQGLRARVEGTLDLDTFGKKEPPAPKDIDPVALAARQIARGLGYLEGFRFAETPELYIQLRPGSGPEAPVSGEMEIDYAGGVEHRGFRFTALRARATFHQRRFKVESLEIRETPDRKFVLQGRVDLERERVTLELTNTLQRYALEAVSPFSLDALLANLQTRVEGKTHFTLRLDDTPLQNIGQTLRLDLDAEEAFYKDVFFPEISFRLEKNGKDVRLLDIDGRLGRGKGSGPVSGSVEVADEGDRVAIDLRGAFYPDQAISLLGPNSEGFVRDWEFRGPPPEFRFTFTKESPSIPVRMDLAIDAENAFCRGTIFQSIEGKVELKDNVLRIYEINASRGTHSATGEVSMALDDQWVDMKLVSTFPPGDLAPFFGEAAVTLVRPVRFEGSSWAEVEGRVDFSGNHEHDLKGKFIFNRPTWSWIQFRFLSSSFHLKNQRLEFADVDGRLEDGAMKGTLLIEDLFEKHAAFDAALEVKNADLFKVITAATDTTDTPYKGKLTLDLELDGNLRSTPDIPVLNSLNGKGEIAIREGTLFRIPLLLGLSRILNKVVGGFGYAAQTDFTADFTITDGVIASKNLFLEGNLLSIAGDGTYQLGGNLRANLKVQLLNRGLLSEALKVLTWPIRKLIEIRLRGTLDQPEWEPRNLPRELFGK